MMSDPTNDVAVVKPVREDATFVLSVTSALLSMPSNLDPSVDKSRPSTFPDTVMLPVTEIPVEETVTLSEPLCCKRFISSATAVIDTVALPAKEMALSLLLLSAGVRDSVVPDDVYVPVPISKFEPSSITY